VSSANIACGFHAGDPDVMARTMTAARRQGVGLGAHPGFADLQGFGRNRIAMPTPSIANAVRYQLGAAKAMARAAGGHIGHLKLHGALANMAAERVDLAHACFEAALSVDPDLVIVAIAASAQQEAATALGCRIACEVYADRGYTEDGQLISRANPGAVLHDPDAIATRVCAMIRAGGILSDSGILFPTPIDTICLHGDTAGAVDIAKAVRHSLTAAGIQIRPMAQMQA
jgi:UPF0271 protein